MIKYALLFQLITIRTAPVAIADQFAVFPAENDGMGGVAIATRDALADPFTNPAKGARLRGTAFFGSPTTYSVSHNAGGGRTLPLSTLATSGAWFGGLMVAIQQIDPSREPTQFFSPPILETTRPVALPSRNFTTADRAHGNTLAWAGVGRRLARGYSLGASASWAGITGIDGVDLLYANSVDIAQRGHALDLRLGLVNDAPDGRSFEALLLMNRFAMTHDVTWLDTFWDPGTQSFASRPRIESNHDQTNVLGAHVAMERPLAQGWRFGALATANRMTHPKIPDYSIQSVPRDPGESWAYNVGVGVSRTTGPARFGLDAIYEPIRTHTWSSTVDNHFTFSNWAMRMGLSQSIDIGGALRRALELQLGLNVRSIGYHLRQLDLAAATGRTQDERWVEWTPTWGLSLRFPDLEIRYRGRSVNGTGRPSTFGGCPQCAFADAVPAGINVLATPSGPLFLQDVTIVTHQISVAVPLR